MKRSRTGRRAAATEHFAGIESLEPRIALAVVHWTGAGDGVTLNNRYNWEHNNLPAHNDIAIVDVAGAPHIEHNSGYFRAKELLLTEELTVRGGTLDVGFLQGDVGGVVKMEGGVFTGEGRLRINGLFHWSGGSIVGDGDIDIGADGHLVISGEGPFQLGRDISSRGRIDWMNGDLDGVDQDGTFLVNEQQGVLRAAGEGRFRSFDGAGYLDNRGTFVRAEQGHTQFLVPALNSGTINVAGGRLELFAGGENTGGRNVAEGGTLHYFGDFTHGAGSTLAGGGNTIFQGGVHTIAADQSMDSYLYVSNATVTGAGLWTIDGVLGWSHGRIEGAGGTIIGETGKIEIRTEGQHTLARDIVNNGTLIWNRGPLGLEGATITNSAARQFYLAADATAVDAAGENRIVNHGEIRKVLPTDIGFGGVTLDNLGEVNVRNGSLTLGLGAVAQIAGGTLSGGAWSAYGTSTLSFSGAAVETVGAGATLTRTGALAGLEVIHAVRRNEGTIALTGGGVCEITPVGGTFVNAGTLELGSATTVAIQGDFVQEGSGLLGLGIAGPAQFGCGRLASTGMATLAGGLSARLALGYAPAPGATFSLLAAPIIQGSFVLVPPETGPLGTLLHGPDGVAILY